MPTSSTIPTPVATRARSTNALPGVGEIVLVSLDHGIPRPLIVTSVGSRGRVSGVICGEPEDGSLSIFRDGVQPPALISGVPSRLQPTVCAQHLPQGHGIGEWHR